MLQNNWPSLVLAPMEGVTDAPMRALQGSFGTFRYCVSEFLRVTQTVPPRSVFERHIPELSMGCHTQTGLPVQVQLLGGDATRLAETAQRAVQLGAIGIDLNFGCPAKTVNRHDGGATLLKYPERIREIVSTVRSAVPESIPVSAKMRLGWDCVDAIHRNAEMAARGGANWITIHARTRMQGYQPPVNWKLIGEVRRNLDRPIIANGDIWSLDDFFRCRDETGCIHFMLGRGALANPRLPYQVAAELGLISASQIPHEEPNWFELMQSLENWTRPFMEIRPEQSARRMKQWLRLAAVHGPFEQFDRIKVCQTSDALLEVLRSESFMVSDAVESVNYHVL